MLDFIFIHDAGVGSQANKHAASKPQVQQSEPHQSVAGSEDFYSLSDPATSSSQTIVRYATPDSHQSYRPPSSAQSAQLRTHPAEQPLQENRSTPSVPGNSVRFGQDRVIPMSPRSESSRRIPSDLATPAPTPGVDDSPYVHYAIDQLTRDGEYSSLARQDSVDHYPASRLVWDDQLGCFIRAPDSPPQTPVQPPERPVPPSVEPESFIPVDAPGESLLYPSLDFVPVVLRWWALLGIIVGSLLMIAGIVFCNVWSQRNQGLWNWDGENGPRYFVFQFLPQIPAAIIIIWSFVIQAAVYRTMPFAIMASQRQQDGVIQSLPVLCKNFILPDLSHFRYGEPAIGFSLLVIWLSNWMSMPLLSCLFQPQWYAVDGVGLWRWTSVQAIGWTLVAVYGLLTIGFAVIMTRYARRWTGLMWDPTSLADQISVIQRSNILHSFEYSEMFAEVGRYLNVKPLRLGYWTISNRHDLFYGIGEENAGITSPSLHQVKKNGMQPLSTVSFDLERRSSFADDLFEQNLYSPSARYRWTPWFLRKTVIVAWTVTIFGLFIAFLLVSFIQGAIEGGFPPRLPTQPDSGAFSSSNFLYSFLPSLIGTALFLLWQPIDVSFRALQPFAALSDPNGTPAATSLLLAYPSSLPFETTFHAILNKHYKVAWISLISVLSSAIPIISGGTFIALWSPPQSGIRIITHMPAFYALIAFCALYTVSFLTIWPGRKRYLPHDISTLADIISFLYQSPLLSDKILREPRSKTDLITRLVIAPPGDREYPLYAFGVYIGRDGKEHLGVDRLRRPGRPDMFFTTG